MILVRIVAIIRIIEKNNKNIKIFEMNPVRNLEVTLKNYNK